MKIALSHLVHANLKYVYPYIHVFFNDDDDDDSRHIGVGFVSNSHLDFYPHVISRFFFLENILVSKFW